jgi:hypothetical protein
VCSCPLTSSVHFRMVWTAVGSFLLSVVPSPRWPSPFFPAAGSRETWVRTTKRSETLLPHITQRTLTPAVCRAVRSEAACEFVPKVQLRPQQAAAHSGGHVFVIGGAIAQLAYPVTSCSRIRRDMRQNYEMFLPT